jgi:UDP-N-acetylglucosamine diphosphorylase/glucosamine-1-phosphate N-acetyltransferase
LLDPEKLRNSFSGRKKKEVDAVYLKYIFDFIKHQPGILKKDLQGLFPVEENPVLREITVLGKREMIFIHPHAKVHPGIVLDTRQGPVYIGEGAEVVPPGIVQGPCFIGKNVLVDGAKLRPGNSFFEGCKVSGEVEESVFLEYVNKHHDGFIGHSYIGSFVNFGAMSTNSDLKNNYSPVKLRLNGEWVDSGSIKLGAFVGDHTKFSIGSLLNTGSVIGTGCNLYQQGGMYPKFVPSFSWGGNYPFARYRWKEFEENTRKIMKRRNREPSGGELAIFQELYARMEDEIYEKMD